MKKQLIQILGWIMVFSLLFSMAAFAAPEQMPGVELQETASAYFEDVQGDGADAVDYLYEQGIILGTVAPTANSLGKFSPDDQVLRCDFVKMVVAALDIQEEGTVTFRDVPTTKYYAKSVSVAATVGLVNGIGNGYFAPTCNITKQEIATILFRAVEENLTDAVVIDGEDWVLGSSQPARWAKDAVQALAASGVMNAENVSDSVTRLDAAVLLATFLQTDLSQKLPPESYDETLVIVHTNDTHGYIQNEAKVKAVADYYKNIYGDNVITMSAGDIYAGGAAIAHYYKGELIQQVMETVGYDYVTPGNNDFNLEDKDPGQNEVIAQNATYKTLAANLYYKDENGDITDELVFSPYDIVETVGGVKVGIFGLALLGRESDCYYQSDDLDAASEMVRTLQDEGCGVILCLGHKGWKGEPDDSSITNSGSMATDYGSAILADETEGLDALIDGHSHSIINNGDGWISPNTGCIVTQAGEKGNTVGVLKLYIKDGVVVKRVADIMDEDALSLFLADKEAQNVIDAAYAKFDEDTKKPVGETPYNLNAARLSGNDGIYGIRTDETNMGDLTSDALRWKLDSDVAIMSAGGIRASIPAGEISLGDWFSVFSNGGYYTASDITGQALLETIASGMSSLPGESPGFIQVSGIKFSYVLGDGFIQIVDPTVNGVPLETEKLYRTAQFDGTMSNETIEGDNSVTGMDALADMMVDYLATGAYVIYPDEPHPDNRMVEIDEVPDGSVVYTIEVSAGMMP